MSRAESGYGRRGRRGGARRAGRAYTEDHADDYGHDEGHDADYDPEEDFSAEYGHTRSEPADADTDRAADGDGYDDYDEYEDYEDEDGESAAPAEESAGSGRSRRRKGRGSTAASRRRGGSRRGGVGKVSAFSASAIKKVSVLGDRPNQIVYTLAEQSKRKRGTAVLGVLLGAFSVALVALLGLLSFQLFTGSGGTVSGGDESVVAPPEGHSTLTPELYLSEPNREDVFGSIDQRPEDAEPMTEESVFGSVGEIGLDDMTLELRQSSVTDSCTSLVWGDQLGQSLIDANCVQAATGVYTDSGDEHIAQVTVFDLADVEGAAAVEESLDPTNAESGAGFLLTQNGDDIPGLQDGYSQANAQVMGHYLAVFWVADTDGADPGDNADMAKLSVASMNAARFVYEEVVEVDQSEE